MVGCSATPPSMTPRPRSVIGGPCSTCSARRSAPRHPRRSSRPSLDGRPREPAPRLSYNPRPAPDEVRAVRALRIIGIIFGCFVAAIIIAVIAVRLIVNPNDYKGRIEQAVKTSTGRDLSLEGPIRLSIFPWIAVQFGPASLGNPPGFGSQPFANLQRASLRVRVFPLLRKELQVGRVEVDGLDLRLRKNAQGHGNWEMSQAGHPAQPSGSSSANLQ